MPVFRPPFDSDAFTSAHAARWLHRIALHLDDFIGPADELWQSIPDWITDFFKMPDVPKNLAKSDGASQRKWMTQHLSTLQLPDPEPSGHLWQNIEFLSERLKLSDDERMILTLSVSAFEHPILHNAMTEIDANGFTDAVRKLAFILEVPEQSVRTALGSQGTLIRLDFLEYRREASTLISLIDPDSFLTETVCRPHASADALFAEFAPLAARSPLTELDFRHLNLEWDMLARTVEAAVLNATPGTNILLHGVPGSGKTEFAKIITQTLGFQLYAIGCEKISNGETATANDRLTAYRLAQATLANHGRAVIVFDDAEDVFLHDMFLHSESSELLTNKSYLSRILENNSVPTIWISKESGQIDPSYRRRFDHALKMQALPYAKRRELVAERLAPHGISAALQMELAGYSKLLPYHVEKLEQHLKRMQRGTQVEAAEEVVEESAHQSMSPDQIVGMWLREHSELLGDDRGRFRQYANGTSDVFNVYRLPFVWENYSLTPKEQVCLTNLFASSTTPDCAILISGQPGSGKTEFAKRIGLHFDRPVVMRNLEEFMSWKPGVTEKSLREAFRAAAEEDAIILLEQSDDHGMMGDTPGIDGQGLYGQMLTHLAKVLSEHRGMVIMTIADPKKMDARIAQYFAVRFALAPLSKERNYALFEELCGSTVFNSRPLLKASLDTLSLMPQDYVGALDRMRLHALGLADAADEIEDVLHTKPSPYRIEPRLLLHHLKVRIVARQIATLAPK